MTDSRITIDSQTLGWQDVVRVARHKVPLSLSDSAWQRIGEARQAVETFADSGQAYYGINTGLGALCDVVLDRSQLQQLSWHTLMSHSCGVGTPLRSEQVRAIICAAVINYSHGCSGVSPAVVQGLIRLLNEDITPVVPSQGSVGYLSHMAHIGLALLGQGEVEFQGRIIPAAKALAAVAMSPVELGPKDGLCLVNGTPAMTGLACLTLDDSARLASWADLIGAMSFEVLRGQLDALSLAVTLRKVHPGVQHCGESLRQLLADSQVLADAQGDHLQDALSLRSIPQVHGACRDQFHHAARQVNGELNSATDNPLVIRDQGDWRVISQANPHGESVAMACDLLAIAVCEWSSISERRSYRLVTPQANQLPPFLIQDSGVKSGMMIAQYSAASLVADNKRLAQPAVTDNFVTSGLQEDHLSFGESAALKLDKALANAFHVLAIEYLLAAQAFDLSGGTQFGRGTRLAWQQLRSRIAVYEELHSLHLDMRATCELMREVAPLASLRQAFPLLDV